MKIDSSNPRHWIYLVLFTLTIALATLLRALNLVKPGKTCLLYGHKLNGNLKAIYDYSQGTDAGVANMQFLTMDVPYFRKLRLEGIDAINGANPLNAPRLASAQSIVSDHGLHSLSLLQKFSDIPFFDVWHAIPLKGFDQSDFLTQRKYRNTFVTSEAVRRVYIEKFGFSDSQVIATGYPRTDDLINRTANNAKIKSDLGVKDHAKKIILFAPTWQQDDPDRSIIPFGGKEEEFFDAIEKLCRKTNSLCIFRTHLNSEESDLSKFESVLFRPHSHLPDTEDILQVSDCLVSDWSSIVFDYMLLDRPTVFLDVPHLPLPEILFRKMINPVRSSGCYENR